MTVTLNELTDWLLYKDPDHAAELLDMADRYIDLYNEGPSRFILPSDHAMLAPLIGLYAAKPIGLVGYVRGVRDSFPANSAIYQPLHKLYRRLSGRYVQQVRRERMNRAMAKAIELYGDAPYQTKRVWLDKLERMWAQRRLRHQTMHRTGRSRLSRDELSDVLAEFWDMIDAEIEAGERIPKWE
jgi:hypothetical protein